MALGRAGHDVVYQKMKKPKYASSNPTKEMDTMMSAHGARRRKMMAGR